MLAPDAEVAAWDERAADGGAVALAVVSPDADAGALSLALPAGVVDSLAGDVLSGVRVDDNDGLSSCLTLTAADGDGRAMGVGAAASAPGLRDAAPERGTVTGWGRVASSCASAISSVGSDDAARKSKAATPTTITAASCADGRQRRGSRAAIYYGRGKALCSTRGAEAECGG